MRTLSITLDDEAEQWLAELTAGPGVAPESVVREGLRLQLERRRGEADHLRWENDHAAEILRQIARSEESFRDGSAVELG